MTFTRAYVLRDVLGTHFAVPVDRELGEGRKCFELPDEGAWLWRALERGEEHPEAGLAEKFGLELSMAEELLGEFEDTLAELGIAE